jgi:hypothetical protein
MKLPVRVESVDGARRTAGEPEWKVVDKTGWPVCLCWNQQYAERIAESLNAAPPDPEPPARVPTLGD